MYRTTCIAIKSKLWKTRSAMDRAMDSHRTKRSNKCHYKDENVRMNCDTNRLTLLLEPPSEPLRVFVDWCPPLFEHQEDNESPVRP